MYAFDNPLFWLFFFFFFFISFLIFYTPGSMLVRKLPLSPFQKAIVGCILGIVLWGYVGLIGGYLGVRWISYVYIAVCCFLFLWQLKTNTFSNISFPKIDRMLATIIILGFLTQLLAIWPAGMIRGDTLYFCCGYPTDYFYQLALTTELTNVFPPYEPGFFGQKLYNYHFLTNLVVADMVRIFQLPLVHTFFQFFSIPFTLLVGLSAVVFAQVNNFSKAATRWLLFLLFFSGDLIYLALLLMGKGFHPEFHFIYSAAELWISPQRVFAVFVTFAGLALMSVWIRKNNLFSGILMAILFASLIAIKAYFAFFILFGLVPVGILLLIKKEYKKIVPLLLTAAISALFYFPINTNAGGLVFVNFWRFENYIVQPMFDLGRVELARIIYAQHNNIPRMMQYELMYMAFFITTIFGILLVGFYQTKKSLSYLPRYVAYTLVGGMLTSFLIGSFFFQKTGGYNTVQFLINILVLGTIFTALSLSAIQKKMPSKYKIFFTMFVILLSLPPIVFWTSYHGKMVKQGGYTANRNELAAVTFISQKYGSGKVLYLDPKSFDTAVTCNYFNIPAHNYLYFCEGGTIRDRGVDVEPRRKIAQTILRVSDTSSYTLLKKEKIDFILAKPKNNFEQRPYLEKIYSTPSIVVYKIR